MPESETILVLGIGNLLWADEGFGIRAAEEFVRRYEPHERVTVLDGGTQGLYLLPHVQAASHLLVFDAIDYGLEPGTMKVVLDDEVPSFMGAKKMSLHQTGFQDVLAAAQLTGQAPRHLVLIGVQPVELSDYGGSLREPVRAQIGPAVDLAAEWLERWGVTLCGRASDEEPAMATRALDMDAYEAGRPSEAEASRKGDPRFLPGGST
ncbi:MAG: HyaD/HybD family hydrogenase maturation endopeptidase [Steroidobacteraceae bacterium]|jgi:hydrogenase maturation protease|nr:HyaD/HybD family hydrogenase maturation endopeptidase [Steroidobacteraceae bacterium]